MCFPFKGYARLLLACVEHYKVTDLAVHMYLLRNRLCKVWLQGRGYARLLLAYMEQALSQANVTLTIFTKFCSSTFE